MKPVNPLLLLSAVYEGGKIILKFYRQNDGALVRYNAGEYNPYNLVESGIGKKKLDLLTDSVKKFTQVTPGTGKEWESSVRPVDSYLYDTGLTIGRWYTLGNGPQLYKHEIKNEKLLSIVENTKPNMPDDSEYKEWIFRWVELLDEPIPEIRRVAFDIETEQDDNGDLTITTIAFSGSGIDMAMILSEKIPPQDNLMIKVYDNEGDMIRDAISIMDSFPIILSWYGDEFDLPHLYDRAVKLNVKTKGLLKNIGEKTLDDNRTVHRVIPTNNIHIDLYTIFSNHSLQNYAFGGRYNTYGLGVVAEAMLGEKKIGSGEDVGKMSPVELALYCHNDARLTYKLSTFDDSIVMRLIIILSRISSIPIDRLSRSGISKWILSMMYKYMREHDMLIPNNEYIKSIKSGSVRDNYQGGLVLEPAYGVHWDVTVLDFASMYPGIIKEHNISWETVRCPHTECRDTIIPGTTNWRCTKRNGMLALMVGTLREVRVRYYKVLARDKSIPENMRIQFDTVGQAIKVLMNASYGVMGSSMFDLYYLPVAESITGVGRSITLGSKKLCETEGIKVLGGDTDSLFVIADKEKISTTIGKTKKLYGAELEIDKKFKYAIFSDRKKNYLGVDYKGRPIIKGLTGKKSHTPKYIAKRFKEIITELSSMDSPVDVPKVKERLVQLVKHDTNYIKNGNIAVDEMAFRMKVSKPLYEYGKSGSIKDGTLKSIMKIQTNSNRIPQHIRAAIKLSKQIGRVLQKGEIIAFVKTATKEKVQPMEFASGKNIDRSKYIEHLISTYDQILPPLGISTKNIIVGHSQQTLNDFLK